MIVHIIRDASGHVAAMGHRVAMHLGGEPELKRRVLQSLAQLDAPPDEIRFERLSAEDDQPEPEAAAAEPEHAPEAPPAEAPEQPAPAPPQPPARGKAPPRRKGKA